LIFGTLALFMSIDTWNSASAQEIAVAAQPKRDAGPDMPKNVLSPVEWKAVDLAVDRALKWLASEQQPDGSFPTRDTGQPAISSLCMMAFMSHGHVPGSSRYGPQLKKATDYLISCQKPNGLITLLGPDGPQIDRAVAREIGGCGAYNHAISSLALSEIYGMSPREDQGRLKSAIQKALYATLQMQRWPKQRPTDRGGWRYIDKFEEIDSDLSVTGWELMFLRSAKNAGFAVPKESINDAIAFVKRSFDEREGLFIYSRQRPSRTRSMAGAGIVALAHAGFHHSQEAQRAGDWLLEHGFETYNATIPGQASDRYHYGVFICCQAMYQLGGKYWEAFYPPVVQTVLANQLPDGSWPVDSQYHDAPYGSAYTTALVTIMLGAPNQLLPIFQR
jgi:hypothetical protein